MVHPEVLTKYKTVIGLEVHIQLATNSKMFGTESASFTTDANRHLSVITIAHPGALPFINREAITSALTLGCALNCHINPHTYFARKNYFYPDLPKGYQISQHLDPICGEGYLDIMTGDHTYKRITIERIHIEEDAGKSIHDQDPYYSHIDLNRAGICLLELVTAPDMNNAEEAVSFFTEIRKIVRFLKVCEGNMEEGNLRCDANVSVMRHNDMQLGTRVEIKNLNSFQALLRAINFESNRQINELEAGNSIYQETRSWDPIKQQTLVLRRKETADDYRYFPDPDLQPISIKEEELVEIRTQLPRLPQALYKEYRFELDLPENEAQALVEQKELSDYFEDVRSYSRDAKASANWILGPVKAYLNEIGKDISEFPLNAKALSGLIQLVKEGKVSHDAAKKRIFPEMLHHPNKAPLTVAEDLGVIMQSQVDTLSVAMDELMKKHVKEVTRYKKGKKGLKGFFVGKLMQQFKGKANPKEVNEIVQQKLDG